MSALNELGAFLRCMVCHRTKPVGDVSQYQVKGWPNHCGMTMLLYTGREGANLGDRQ